MLKKYFLRHTDRVFNLSMFQQLNLVNNYHTLLWEPVHDFKISNAVKICIESVNTSASDLVRSHNGIGSVVNPV